MQTAADLYRGPLYDLGRASACPVHYPEEPSHVDVVSMISSVRTTSFEGSRKTRSSEQSTITRRSFAIEWVALPIRGTITTVHKVGYKFIN